MSHRLTYALLLLTAMSVQPNCLRAQSIFGPNLIVNGDAESGPGDPDGHTPVSSIPGWIASGSPDVVQYASDYDIGLNDVIPLSMGSNYFYGGRPQATSSLTQNIDLSAGAADIDQGTVTFALAGYLGGFQSEAESSQFSVAFFDASGRQLSSLSLGPISNVDRSNTTGLWYRRGIGPVPSGARSATVVLQMNWISSGTNDAAADNLSLVLKLPGTADSLFGSNLIVNGNAEAQAVPSTVTISDTTVSVPGWCTESLFTIEPYGDPNGDLSPTSPGPADAGNYYFYGGPSNGLSSAYQDIDVSSAASLIDSAAVQYSLSAWLGGYSSQNDNATLQVQFQDWDGNVLGSAVTLGPFLAADRNNVSELLMTNQNGAVPVGTRDIHVFLAMTRTDGSDNDGMADSLSLVLSGPGGTPPALASIGSAAAFGSFSGIAPGTWIEIYGTNLAPDTRSWEGSDFNGSTAPTTLDGVEVTIDGQAAFIDYISPGQVNAQVPSNVGSGAREIVVSNDFGTSADYSILVNSTQPGLLAPASFNIGGTPYVVAILPDGSYVLPDGAISGIASRPAVAGDTITLYGIGFGPVNPDIQAGQVVNESNQLALDFSVSIGGVQASLTYWGLAPNYVGLYQFNVVVPDIQSSGPVPLTFTLGGAQGQQTLYLATQ